MNWEAKKKERKNKSLTVNSKYLEWNYVTF